MVARTPMEREIDERIARTSARATKMLKVVCALVFLLSAFGVYCFTR